MFSLICAWINGSVNNDEAGDLGHHRAHYDVTVMNIEMAIVIEKQQRIRSAFVVIMEMSMFVDS